MRYIISFTILSCLSCTQNQRSRNFGGTETVKIPEHCKIINTTWKADDLWIFLQDTTTGQYYFQEKSSFGALEGRINFE